MTDTERKFLNSLWQFKKYRMNHWIKGFSRTEMMLISILTKKYHEDPECTVRVAELIAGTGLSAPEVSRTLKNLEKKGVVKRMTDPGDRRNTIVFFTDESKETVKKNVKFMDAYMDELVNRMGEEKIRTITAYMNELSQKVDEVLNDMCSSSADAAEREDK